MKHRKGASCGGCPACRAALTLTRTLTLSLTLRRYPQLPPFLASTWFPDRRGLVVSIYMTSFGSGMLFAVPVLQSLLAHFRTAPVRCLQFKK